MHSPLHTLNKSFIKQKNVSVVKQKIDFDIGNTDKKQGNHKKVENPSRSKSPSKSKKKLLKKSNSAFKNFL